jgi:hypothetical protein
MASRGPGGIDYGRSGTNFITNNTPIGSPNLEDEDSIRFWNPVWLYKWVLFSLSGCFLSLLVILVLLLRISDIHHGLVNQIEGHRYAWTYGPTALLVLLSALWRQVDHATKLLTPWHNMRKGLVPASQSLSLDYISPFIGAALCSAMKNRHWGAALSMTGFLLLKLSVVFSTGIFVLQPTAINVPNILQTVSAGFNGADFASKAVTSQPVLTYYGIVSGNLSYPRGVTNNLVIQDFAPKDVLPNQLDYTANVFGLDTLVDCEPAQTTPEVQTMLPWYRLGTSFLLTNITTSDCSIDQYVAAAGADHDRIPPNATKDSQGRWDFLYCGSKNNNLQRERRPWNSNFNDSRIVISMADLR